VDLLAEHVREARDGLAPVTAQPDPDALASELEVERWIREGGMDAAALATWLPDYLAATVRLHHPGSMVHQVGVPSTGAALADLIHGVTNNPMAKYEMGAAGATLEREVVRWLLEKVGFDPDAGAGVLTHGGSLANLTALLAARARVVPDAWRQGVPPDLALLAPPWSTTRSDEPRRSSALARTPSSSSTSTRSSGSGPTGSPGRSSAAPPPAGDQSRSARWRVRGAPGCTTICARSAPSARSTGSGCTPTQHTGLRRCSPTATATCSTASSSQTRSSGTPTRCCARQACAPQCSCGTDTTW